MLFYPSLFQWNDFQGRTAIKSKDPGRESKLENMPLMVWHGLDQKFAIFNEIFCYYLFKCCSHSQNGAIMQHMDWIFLLD